MLNLTSTAGGYGLMLLQSLLALAAFGLFAWLFFRWSTGAFSRRPHSQGRVEVLERIPLDARRCLYLVRCGDRAMLLGAGDNTGPQLLADFPARELPAPSVDQAQRFTAILKRIQGSAPSIGPAQSKALERSKGED